MVPLLKGEGRTSTWCDMSAVSIKGRRPLLQSPSSCRLIQRSQRGSPCPKEDPFSDHSRDHSIGGHVTAVWNAEGEGDDEMMATV